MNTALALIGGIVGYVLLDIIYKTSGWRKHRLQRRLDILNSIRRQHGMTETNDISKVDY